MQFQPTASGPRDATLSFDQNDATQSTPFSFVVGGVGLVPAIAVTGNGQPIVDGSATTDSATGTDYGSVSLGTAASVQTYSIANNGNGTLELGAVSISGPAAGDFTITAQPAASVAPGGSTTFSVQFQPTAGGERDATLSFAENDSTEPSPYSFAVVGTGVIQPPAYSATITYEAADASGNMLASVPAGTSFELARLCRTPAAMGQRAGSLRPTSTVRTIRASASIPSDATGPVATFATLFASEQSENAQEHRFDRRYRCLFQLQGQRQ